MKKKKYLDFYRKALADDSVFKYNYKGDFLCPLGCGLCFAFYRSRIRTNDLDQFIPPPKLFKELWYGGTRGKFTPLRQNIVLFLAAMNNEL